MTDGLKDKHRQAIIDILAANTRVKRVALFGSRAMGTFTTTSDVDLALYGDELTLTDQAKLAAAIDDLPMAQRVDLLLYKSIDNDNLKEHIRKYGVEWFRQGWGKSTDWTKKCLGDILTLQRGHDLPSQSRVNGSVPIMGSAGLTGYHNKSKTNGPGVVVGRSGNSMGEVHYTIGDYWPLNTVLYVTDFKGNDERFIYYFLKSISFNQFNSGSAQKSLNRNAVYPHQVMVPTNLAEQKKIASILGDLDDKIELNRQIYQTLEQIAQAIFKSWFVDFEPVKAKIAAKENGQDPERAAMCAISGKSDAELKHLPADQLSQLATTAALFPDELVESELGMIPRGWEVKKIMDWGTVICGKTPPKKDPCNYGGSIPFIKIPDMHGNVFATTTNDTLSKKGASTQPKKEIPKGSVCVSCIATVGQVVIASENSHSNQQINSIVPENMEHTSFLYFSMRERNMLLHELSSGGSATLNLNTGNFSKIPLFSPGAKLLTKFSKIVWPIFKHILASDRQSQNLAQLRDTLLPKLLSGEITIADTQTKIEAAV